MFDMGLNYNLHGTATYENADFAQEWDWFAQTLKAKI
jgi:hypothetical protein